MTIENREPLNDNYNDNEDDNSIESTKNKGYYFNGCCSFLLLPAAIGAVVIAVMHPIYYCSEQNFIINAEIFLYVAGFVNIGWFAIRLIIDCCSYGYKKCVECAHYLIGVFNLVWAAIGLYFWMNKMDPWCQHKTSVGIMVLSWCINVLFFIFVTICCCNRKTSIEMTKTESNGECDDEGTKGDDIDDNNENKEGNETLV